jgi:hypothetical protein
MAELLAVLVSVLDHVSSARESVACWRQVNCDIGDAWGVGGMWGIRLHSARLHFIMTSDVPESRRIAEDIDDVPMPN